MTRTTMFAKAIGIVGIAAILPCLAHPLGQTAIQWHADLHLRDLSALPTRMSASEVPDDSESLTLVRDAPSRERKRVTTCAEYLAAIDSGFDTRTTRDVNNELRFVRDCFVLRDLRNAKAPTADHLPSWNYGILSVIPPILEWGENQDPPQIPPLTWQSANPAVRGTDLTETGIGAEDDSSRYYLQRIATGDFNGDGTADMAIVADVSAKEGSYSRRDYMILTFCAGAQHLVRH